MSLLHRAARLGLILLLPAPFAAQAQAPGGAPPAVGTVAAVSRPVTQTNEFVGRVQAVDRVDLVARVTAFIMERAFIEGAEVAKGATLYKLERGPFEADVAAKAAAVAQAQALTRNASLTLGRAASLLNGPAGQRSTVDDATAQQASQNAQLIAAQAQLRASQINLDYTEIKAPVAGKITRTALTVGNVVTPASGPLATIVSQDPMYVLFPVSSRTAAELADRYAGHGGLTSVKVRLRLPDGAAYAEAGSLDYVDPTVSPTTDTQTFRAVIANPLRPGTQLGEIGNRALVDGAFLGVIVEGPQPVQTLVVPRVAVLEDQRGAYVYVVGGNNIAEQRRVTLGQSTPGSAAITKGLVDGEQVIADGLQSVHPGALVAPAPLNAASPPKPAPAEPG